VTSVSYDATISLAGKVKGKGKVIFDRGDTTSTATHSPTYSRKAKGE
jgi:hypothetical protein